MAGISSLGTGSGLDLNSLIEQLVAAERAPVENRLNLKEADLQAKLSAFGTLKGAVSSLQDSLKGMTKLGTDRSATSSDDTVLTATAESTALVGEYSVEVSNLAYAHSLASKAYESSTSVVGTGTLTIDFGTTDYTLDTDTYTGFITTAEKGPHTVTIDETNNTLEGLKNAINEANIGVNAVIVNDGSGYRLLLSSEETGAENSLEITVTDDAGSGLADFAFNASSTAMEQTVTAQDAQITVNGLEITSASNSIGDAIPGVTLNLENESDETIKLDVGLDKQKLTEAMDAFIEEYNALNEQIKSLTSYNTETQEAAVLLGDSSVRGLISQLRNALVSTIEVEGESDTSTFHSLVDIGVKSDQYGEASLDSSVLSDAIEEDFTAVASLLNGFGDSLDDSLYDFLSIGGAIDSRTRGIQSRLDDIGDERDKLDRHIESLETRWVKQFGALDTLLGQMQNTSAFLTQQLSTLNFQSNN
jgi:flagellar hook-associated protein 2